MLSCLPNPHSLVHSENFSNDPIQFACLVSNIEINSSNKLIVSSNSHYNINDI